MVALPKIPGARDYSDTIFSSFDDGSVKESQMAGKVGQDQAVARLSEEAMHWELSIQDQHGVPLLTFTCETIEEADAYRPEVKAIVESGQSLVDLNGTPHEKEALGSGKVNWPLWFGTSGAAVKIS